MQSLIAYATNALEAGLHGIRYAELFPGGDPGEKINNAHADLPAAGGIIDCRGFADPSTITTQINFTKPVELWLPAGTLNLAAKIHTTASLKIRGAGTNASILVANAVLDGANVIDVDCAAPLPVEFSDFLLDATAAGSAVGIALNNVRRGWLRGLRILGGAKGVYGPGVSLFTIEGCWVYNQSDTCIHIQGDGGMENSIFDTWVGRDQAGTTTNGLFLERNSAADTGGLYMENVRVNCNTGNMTYGIRCENTHTTNLSGMPIMAVSTVIDGNQQYGLYLRKLQGQFFVDQLWSSLASPCEHPVVLDNMAHVQLSKARLTGDSGGIKSCISLRNGGSEHSFKQIFAVNGPAIGFDAGPIVNFLRIHTDNIQYDGTGAALSTHPDELCQKQPINEISGVQIQVRSDTTPATEPAASFGLRNVAPTPGPTPKKWLTVRNGALVILSEAGAEILGLSDAGVLNLFPLDDAFFSLEKPSGNPRITFDNGDQILFDRASSVWQLYIGGTLAYQFGASGFLLKSGITGVLIEFDSGDYINYDRTANVFQFYIGNVLKFSVDSNGMVFGNIITLGAGLVGQVVFDANDILSYDRSADQFQFYIGGNLQVAIGAAALGFFGHSPVSKPTITGDRNDASALANLLSALSDLGLLTNSSTATGYMTIAQGGTSANTAAGARTQLGAAAAGTPGAHTITLAKITPGGSDGSIAWNADGVITSYVDPT